MTGSTKLLRRRVLAREYDFDKYLQPAVPTLYDTAEFEPVTVRDLEHLHLVDRIKNPVAMPHWQRPSAWPRAFLFDHKTQSYRVDYFEYLVDVDENDFIWVQYRKNTPRSRIGWAVLTKRY
jgi:hypothetical protein